MSCLDEQSLKEAIYCLTCGLHGIISLFVNVYVIKYLRQLDSVMNIQYFIGMSLYLIMHY